ncbi:MAG: PQQ-binding-like beta-propeller repeat protein [Actinomycetota bacterium]
MLRVPRSVLIVLAFCLLAASCYAESGWPAIHGDARNSDTSDLDGAEELSLAWTRAFDGPIAAAASIHPNGTAWVTVRDADGPCTLHVIDAATGADVWCTGLLSQWVVASSALIDVAGFAYVADDVAMFKFDPDGNVVWAAPVVGVPISAQFTSDNRLFFITHIGRIYVIDAISGAVLLMHELDPGATYVPGTGVSDCLLGGPACPSANTPSIDLDDDRFYFTWLAPRTTDAVLRAMSYTPGATPAVADLWTNSTLTGGTAASPAISLDGTRLYVNDNGGSIHALDAATGASLWDFDLGAAAAGSPSVSDAGLVVSTAGGGSTLQGVQDTGAAGSSVFDTEDVHRGITVQMANEIAYSVVLRDGTLGQLDVVVLDTTDGSELDRVALGGVPIATVGTSIGPDGEVVVPGLFGTVYGLLPVA